MKKIYLKPEIDLTSMYVEQVVCTSQLFDSGTGDGDDEAVKERNVFGGEWKEF